NDDREVLDRNNQRPVDALDRGQKRAGLVVSDHDDGQPSIAGNHPTSLPCRLAPSLANSSLVSNLPTKQTKFAVSSLHSGRTVVDRHGYCTKSRQRASADVVPGATDLHGTQLARNAAPDRGHQRLDVVVRGIRLSVCEPHQGAGQGHEENTEPEDERWNNRFFRRNTETAEREYQAALAQAPAAGRNRDQENNNAALRRQNRQSEILPHKAALATANVSSVLTS